MVTPIEIAGVILAGVSLGGQVVSTAGDYLLGHMSKREAQRTINDVSEQFDQVKSLRKDLSYDQYLSEKERQQLDEIVENLALDLDALHNTLRGLKGINYWTGKTYCVQWCNFNQQCGDVIIKIVEVNVEIRERSIREKQKKIKSRSMPPRFEEGGFPSPHIHDLSRSSPTESDVQRAILDAVASEATSVVRSSIDSRRNPEASGEGGDEPLAQGRILEDGTAHISCPSGRTIMMRTASGTKWRVPLKSSSAPASITVPECVELQDLGDNVD